MTDELTLDPGRCALIIQDMQNDVIIDGGAFAESGSPQHATDQNVVENVKDLAAFCRGKGIPVIHVWYLVDEGAPGLKVNAPLFEGVAGGALVRGTWGAAPVDGGGDFASMLGAAITDFGNKLRQAEAVSINGVKGTASMQDVVEKVMSAEQSLQAVIAVRDKVISAYQEISRMAI